MTRHETNKYTLLANAEFTNIELHSNIKATLKMCSVAYSCDRVILLCALSFKLMYRHFNQPYVLMLHAVLFSLFQCASTVVTYMIVLLQFDQSDKSQNACGRNVKN